MAGKLRVREGGRVVLLLENYVEMVDTLIRVTRVLLGGSWAAISRVISMVTILETLVRVLYLQPYLSLPMNLEVEILASTQVPASPQKGHCVHFKQRGRTKTLALVVF